MTNRPANVVTSKSELNALLEDWAGADASVWLFHPSLRRLSIQLTKGDDESALFVVGVGCVRMSGRFALERAHLRVAAASEEETVLSDRNSNFTLVASSFAALVRARGIRDSFEELLGPETEPPS